MDSLKKCVQCRRATVEDYEGVVNIRDDVHDGLDYLAYLFDDMLKRPKCKAYVAEVDQEIVAFFALECIRSDSHVTASAARVRPGLQGRGIYRLLKMFGLADFKTEHPQIKHLSLFVQDTAEQHRRQKDSTSLYHNRGTYHLGIWTGNLNTTKKFLVEENLDPVVSVKTWINSGGDTSNLKFRTSSQGLFTYGLPWVVDTLNFETIVNVSLIYPIFLTVNEENECVSLSTSAFYFSPGGWVIHHLFVGDTQTYKSHLIKNISALWEKMGSRDSRLNIMLHMPKSVDIEVLMKAFEDLEMKFMKTTVVVELEQAVDLLLFQCQYMA